MGGGIGIMMAEVGDVEPTVRRVLPDLPAIPIPMWLVTHRDVHTSRRVRVVADFLAAGLTRSAEKTRASAKKTTKRAAPA